jgi:methyl-accepting chemotaxis protein
MLKMTSFWDNLTIGRKLALVQVLIIIAALSICGVLLLSYLGNIFIEKEKIELEKQVMLTMDMIETYDKSLKMMVDKTHHVYGTYFNGAFSIDAGRTIRIGNADTPVLKVGGSVLNLDNSRDDRLSASAGAFSSVFVKKGDDFIRISTNVKNPDGTRPLGTLMGKSHAAYESLVKGEAYAGKASAVGKDLYAEYVPVKDAKGSVIGCYAIGFEITESMKALKDKIRSKKIGETGYLFVLDTTEGKAKGTLLIHPAQEGNNIIDSKDSDGHEFIKEMLNAKKGYVIYPWFNKERGETTSYKKIAVFSTYGPWNWLIAGSTNLGELLETGNQVRNYVIAGGVFLLFLLIAPLYIVTSKWISAPLQKGVEFAEQVSRGNLNWRVEAAGNDEIARLIKALNQMGNKLRGIIVDIKDAADKIHMESAELKGQSSRMSAGIRDQSERSVHIATAAEEMSQTVEDIAKNAAGISTSSADTVKIAKDGDMVVAQAVDEVKEIAKAVSDSAQLIASLGDRSQQIGTIVNVIKDIAEQTNLLALNAAIEAARAGEQGRGFAVVADEVRKLAERTSTATSEIAEMITAIQQGVGKAIVSMDGASSKVDSGVDYSIKAGETLKTIVSSIEELQGMIGEIASATEEMANTSHTIGGEIETVSGIAKQISGGFDNIANTAQGFERLSNNLQNTVGQFKVN